MSDEYQMVAVKWRDSTYSNGTFSNREVRDWELLDMMTVGYLVDEREDALVLAQERQRTRSDIEDQWRHLVGIPKVNIVQVEFLEKRGVTTEEPCRVE